MSGNAFGDGTQSGDGAIELTGAGTSHGMAGTFANLELDEAAGAVLADDVTVDTVLTLTSGAFSIGANTLTLNGAISVGSGSVTGGSSSNITFGGSGASTNLPAVTLNNLSVNRANGIGLAGDVSVDGILTLTGGDLDLSGHTVTLGAGALLSETPGNTVIGASGMITTTRTFDAGELSTGLNIAGLGAEITTDAALGQTVISRGHAAQLAGTESSLLRYFDIAPTNNTGLDATLVFHYDDSELNGLTESYLGLGRSTDSGSTWVGEGGTVDTGNETITLGGIDALSRWSAFEYGLHTSASRVGVVYCDVAWGDYDNDGDLDVLVAGETGSSIITRIYRNEGADTFTDVGAGLPGVRNCSVAWGDYDDDGDLNVLVAGETGTGSGKITRVFRNNGGSSFSLAASLTGVSVSSVAWGDYDDDRDLDVLVAGWTGSARITRVYRNGGLETNTAPGSPSGLGSSASGGVITLSWEPATDIETPQFGLTYNLRVGTSPGETDIVGPTADVGTGWRRIPALGNTNHNQGWMLHNLSDGRYYWSVQAIDHGFTGSAFAAEDSFYIYTGGLTLADSISGGDLVLQCNSVPPATSYWVYGAINNPFFAPQMESPFGYRVAVTTDTTWSSAAGIADPDTNWTYQVIAVDGSENELVRSNRVGEHEFALP